MKELTSTLTSKGQVTIPAEVRRHLGVSQGNKLSFVIGDEGTVELKVPTYQTVASLAGAAGSLPRPMSWKEQVEIARDDRLADDDGQEV